MTLNPIRCRNARGFTLYELVIMITVVAVGAAIAVPQLAAARRQFRYAGVGREIVAQLRYARQRAMTQRQAFTFQYDNTKKQIVIIDHQAVGAAVISAAGYPNTAGSVRERTVSLAGGGLPASELVYGRPAGADIAALGDGTNLTALSNGKINITFQPDGSVRNSNDATVNRALFFYNSYDPLNLATAVSVLGSGGRVKQWRYVRESNKYVE